MDLNINMATDWLRPFSLLVSPYEQSHACLTSTIAAHHLSRTIGICHHHNGSSNLELHSLQVWCGQGRISLHILSRTFVVLITSTLLITLCKASKNCKKTMSSSSSKSTMCTGCLLNGKGASTAPRQYHWVEAALPREVKETYPLWRFAIS